MAIIRKVVVHLDDVPLDEILSDEFINQLLEINNDTEAGSGENKIGVHLSVVDPSKTGDHTLLIFITRDNHRGSFGEGAPDSLSKKALKRFLQVLTAYASNLITKKLPLASLLLGANEDDLILLLRLTEKALELLGVEVDKKDGFVSSFLETCNELKRYLRRFRRD